MALVYLLLGCVEQTTETHAVSSPMGYDTASYDPDGDYQNRTFDEVPITESLKRIPHICYPHPADPEDELRCKSLMRKIMGGEYGGEVRAEAVLVMSILP